MTAIFTDRLTYYRMNRKAIATKSVEKTDIICYHKLIEGLILFSI